ncbi:metallophosphoesterase [Fodinisporobacter ferrooxydans]|uniref:Metallophosphoesterase n=1 Tax=Fodinisporobacter ferrooxydans TaxID=2901836 RepID=A0ABY4CNQ0_9BACL|nr:metallophosphoesterase [Alicyclobacillaceae bacterium MYW30-H2]
MHWLRMGSVMFFFCLLMLCWGSAAFAAPVLEPPILRIAVLSDVHVMHTTDAWGRKAALKFEQALADIDSYAPDITIINGDITNGEPTDYRIFWDIVHRHKTGRIFASIGNHEYYRVHHATQWTDDDAKKLFRKEFGLNRLYYDQYMKGIHMVFLGSEAYTSLRAHHPDAAWISPEQVRWFKAQLQKQSKATLVFLHQPLQGTVDFSGDTTLQVLQSRELKQLAEAHTPLIWFSGHTHDSITGGDQSCLQHGVLYLGGGGTFTIHKRRLFPFPDAAREGYVFAKDTLSESESRLVTVFNDHVIVQVRDHIHKVWLPAYEIRYDLKSVH